MKVVKFLFRLIVISRINLHVLLGRFLGAFLWSKNSVMLFLLYLHILVTLGLMFSISYRILLESINTLGSILVK